MANLIKQAMRLIIGDDPRKMLKRPLKPLTDRQLIKLESEIGRTLPKPGSGTNSGLTRMAKKKTILFVMKFTPKAY